MDNRPSQSISLDRPLWIVLAVGVIAALLGIAGLWLSGPGIFFQAYLYAFFFWVGISVGGLGIIMLHFTVNSRWGLAVRRVSEAAAGSIWVLAVLFVPLVIGLPFLYPWARPVEVAGNAALIYQAWYLNAPFFIARAAVYFAVWVALAFFANRLTARLSNSSTDDQATRGKLQRLGAGGSILYLITMTFASVDWLMSLQPSWQSTAFGLIVVVGQVLAAMAFAVLLLNLIPALALGRRWKYDETPIPYQDLGALLLTLVMAWAYVSFFQLLIQWAGNLPREVAWYIARTQGGWGIVASSIALFLFVLPFCLLLTIRIRHNLRLLAWISLILLVFSLVLNFWYVKPAFYPDGFALSWLDVVMPFALGGLWLAAFLYQLKRRPALNVNDQTALEIVTEIKESVD